MKTKKPKAPKAPTRKELAMVPEQMATAGPDRELCKACGRLEEKPWITYVPPGYTGKLLVVSDTGAASLGAGTLSEIRDMAKEAGHGVKDVAFTFAVRCGDSDPVMKQIQCCRPYVLRAIEVLKPKTIIAMGSSALRSVTNSGTMQNVTKHRGRPVPVPGTEHKAYGTYSVSGVLSGGVSNRPRIVEDFRRAEQTEIPYPELGSPEGPFLSVDTEYAPDASLLTVGIANRAGARSAEPEEEDFYKVVGHIAAADEDTTLIGHSLSGDVDKLVELGAARKEWVSGEKTRDSLLLARMKDENRGKGGYELEGLLLSSRNVRPWKQDTIIYSKEDATTWPVELRKERCRLDAWASAVVAHDLMMDPEIQNMPVELVHRVAMSLHRIELAGMYIDVPKFKTLEASLASEREMQRDKLTKLAMSHGMTEFTPTNDDHIRDLLFKRMKLPVIKKTKTEKLPSVDKVTLKQYKDRPEVSALLAFNSADKSYTTNIVRLGKICTPIDDKHMLLAPHINPLGARTGRRSSGSDEEAGIESMNSQNWPVPMRQMVVSRWHNGLILENDYKSLEVFLLAYEAGDDKLFEYFSKRGGYIAIAKEMWKAEVSKESDMYRATKSVVLGTNYNMQTPLMAENLWNMGVRFSSDFGEHEDKTDELRNSYLDMFPGLRPYFSRQRAFLLKHGYVVNKIGQVRHLPLSDGKDTPGFGRMVNQAINFPIQSLASAVTGSGLIDSEEALVAEYFKGDLVEYHARLLAKDWPEMPIVVNEVHDSLLHDVPERYELRAKAIVKECMESTRTLRGLLPGLPPLRVETKLGPHWGVKDA